MSLCTKPTKQVHSNRNSQIWLPSKMQPTLDHRFCFVLFVSSRIHLEINMQPEICKPSHEAHQTSSFKKYLPNLAAFKSSCWHWTTVFSMIYLEINMQREICKPSIAFARRPPNKFVQNVPPPKLTAFKKSSRRWTTGFTFKDLSENEYAARTM